MSKEIKIALIGAVATVLAAIIGGIFLLNSQSANQHNVSSPSPPVPITSATTQSTPFATTSTPSPTPSMITITKNVQIPCTECGSPLGLEFQSIEINRNDNLSVFHFKVTNNGSSQEAVNFQHLSLQDDNGNTSPAQAGTANAGDITYLGPTNSEIVIQTFPLALKPGVHYTMSVMVDSSTFKDQSITVSY